MHIAPLTLSHRAFTLLGVAGLLAAVGVGVGEFLVHYSGGGPRSSAPFAYFADIPLERLTLGHFLIVAFMPLYFLGYAHLFLAVRPAGQRRAVAMFVLGVFALSIGGLWVGSRGFLGHLAHDLDNPVLSDRWQAVASAYTLLLENLLQGLRLLMVGVSIFFASAVLSGRSMYPRWMAMLSPALPAAMFLSSPVVWPAAGALLVPAAMNVAHAILFAASLLVLKSRPTQQTNEEVQA